MYELQYDPQICKQCETIDCLVRCQHMDLDLEQARAEKTKILQGEDSRVLTECITCYACEEYCPNNNHPFYLIVERQEEHGILPAPKPITEQQILMMGPRGKIKPEKIEPPVIDMCFFPMLRNSIQGKLFAGASIIESSDIFCNIMWLHFAKNSIIRERLPRVIDTIWTFYLRDSGVEELVCYHDECYAAFAHLAPAFGMEVPFTPVHLFQYLSQRLDQLQEDLTSLNVQAAYQRPCSNRLIPETDPLLDQIFHKIGVARTEREFDRENTLCCGGITRAQQREELADELQVKNLDDMERSGAQYCVFNCPMCLYTLGEEAEKRGLRPILVSDLCQLALQQNKEA